MHVKVTKGWAYFDCTRPTGTIWRFTPPMKVAFRWQQLLSLKDCWLSKENWRRYSFRWWNRRTPTVCSITTVPLPASSKRKSTPNLPRLEKTNVSMSWIVYSFFRTKARLQDLLQADRDLTPAEFREINPCSVRSIEAALNLIGNPARCCHKIYELVANLVEVIRAKRDDTKSISNKW